MHVFRKTRTITNQNQAEVLQIRRIKKRNRFSFFQNSGFDPSFPSLPPGKQKQKFAIIFFQSQNFPKEKPRKTIQGSTDTQGSVHKGCPILEYVGISAKIGLR